MMEDYIKKFMWSYGYGRGLIVEDIPGLLTLTLIDAHSSLCSWHKYDDDDDAFLTAR